MFQMGDILLIAINTQTVPYNVWLGQVVGIMNRSYSVEPLYPTIPKSAVRIPFLFDNSMQKVLKKDIKKVLNSLKILYFSN